MGKKDATKSGVVYVVTDKREPERVRYVGRTVQGLDTRVYKHWSDASRSGGAFPRWLLSRIDRKEDVVFQEVSWHPDVYELNQAEIKAIAEYRAKGQADLNLTDGGDGGLGIAWTEERIENHKRNVPRGNGHYRRRLSTDTVREIRKRSIETALNSVDLAQEYGVSIATMSEMLRNETWYDPSYNPEDRKRVSWKGDLGRNRKLTGEQVREIREYRQKNYATGKSIAERYGVSKDMIWRILQNHNWHDPAYSPSDLKPKEGNS